MLDFDFCIPRPDAERYALRGGARRRLPSVDFAGATRAQRALAAASYCMSAFSSFHERVDGYSGMYGSP